ncbi:SCP-like protein [Oesophagostomum dentatum]|uniref:SCP-like protein n=1 Tax=Oesophagostomum dentatum TaxID=61180 RepID=A0A0B1S6A2_OESDE|nr:SCP-like protein [Oesophagostomum dentatum]
MCPSNANMTDAARKKFLEVHNYLRSRVARGLEPDALGGNAPKASKMLKMVYDCNVEASAIQHSQKCVYAHSDSADRPGLGENLFKTTALNVDRTSIAAEVTDEGLKIDILCIYERSWVALQNLHVHGTNIQRRHFTESKLIDERVAE